MTEMLAALCSWTSRTVSAILALPKVACFSYCITVLKTRLTQQGLTESNNTSSHDQGHLPAGSFWKSSYWTSPVLPQTCYNLWKTNKPL